MIHSEPVMTIATITTVKASAISVQPPSERVLTCRKKTVWTTIWTKASTMTAIAVVCALAIFHQEIPPTLNLRHPAKGCDLDYVPTRSRPYPIRAAMNLSSGFGGKNACLILGKYEGHT